MRHACCLARLTGCGRVHFDGSVDAESLLTDAIPIRGARFVFHLDNVAGHVVSEVSGQDGYAYNRADVTQLPGILGDALHFDGTLSQSYVMFPARSAACGWVPTFPAGLTASAWVQFDSFHPAKYSLGDIAMMQGTSGGNKGTWGLGATTLCGGETAGLSIAFEQTNRTTMCGTTQLVAGTWYFLTGVWDPETLAMRIYVNGVDDTAGLAPGSPPIAAVMNPPVNCAMLGASINETNLLHGSLDEVSIFERALSVDEISSVHTLFGG